MMDNDDTRIDDLIRAVRRDRGDVDVHVSDEVVHAYLMGRATAAQKSEVRQALIDSPRFREEIIELSRYLETLSTEEAADAFNGAIAPPYGETDVHAHKTQAEVISLWDRMTASVERLLSLPQLRIAVPVAAAAVLMLAVGPWRMVWTPIVNPVTSTQVESSEFAVLLGPSRGAGAADHTEAATLRFRRSLLLRNGRVEFLGSESGLTGTQELATLQLAGRWRRKLAVVTVNTAAGEPRPAPSGENLNAMVWLALLPAVETETIEIRSYVLTGPRMALRWDDSDKGLGAVVVTYEVNGRFHASACVPVDQARP
jgi:hypothetical protein